MANHTTSLCLKCGEKGSFERALTTCPRCQRSWHWNCHDPHITSSGFIGKWTCAVCVRGRLSRSSPLGSHNSRPSLSTKSSTSKLKSVCEQKKSDDHVRYLESKWGTDRWHPKGMRQQLSSPRAIADMAELTRIWLLMNGNLEKLWKVGGLIHSAMMASNRKPLCVAESVAIALEDARDLYFGRRQMSNGRLTSLSVTKNDCLDESQPRKIDSTPPNPEFADGRKRRDNGHETHASISSRTKRPKFSHNFPASQHISREHSSQSSQLSQMKIYRQVPSGICQDSSGQFLKVSNPQIKSHISQSDHKRKDDLRYLNSQWKGNWIPRIYDRTMQGQYTLRTIQAMKDITEIVLKRDPNFLLESLWQDQTLCPQDGVAGLMTRAMRKANTANVTDDIIKMALDDLRALLEVQDRDLGAPKNSVPTVEGSVSQVINTPPPSGSETPSRVDLAAKEALSETNFDKLLATPYELNGPRIKIKYQELRVHLCHLEKKSAEWHSVKQAEIRARGNRKTNFGKGVESLRRRLVEPNFWNMPLWIPKEIKQHIERLEAARKRLRAKVAAITDEVNNNSENEVESKNKMVEYNNDNESGAENHKKTPCAKTNQGEEVEDEETPVSPSGSTISHRDCEANEQSEAGSSSSADDTHWLSNSTNPAYSAKPEGYFAQQIFEPV